MMYKVKIRNFKSIDQLEIEIKPLTILIGPPASGKSNIMEALYPIGLLGKIYKFKEEYSDNLYHFCKNDSNFKNIWRVEEPEDIFPDYNYDSPSKITLSQQGLPLYEASLEAEINELKIEYRFFNNFKQNKNDINNIIRLFKDNNYYCFEHYHSSRMPSTIEKFIKFINNKVPSNKLVEIRYYSFDKYNINNNYEKIIKCDIENDNRYYINNYENRSSTTLTKSCKIPNHVLAESAINLAWRALRSPRVIKYFNDWLEKLGVGIEILVKKTPLIEFYERPIEIKPNLISDGIKRSLYYIIAVSSAINYYNLKKIKQFLLLEEPEAHVYPYINNLFINYLTKGVDNGVYFVISTHNPYFVDSIAEKVDENNLSIYYVYKDVEARRTKAIRITKEALMKSKAYGPGDFLLMTPDELRGDVA